MKVCVIGSGVFGIAAVRELTGRLPAGSVHWLSQDNAAGGLWNSATQHSRVYDSLHLNTSRGPSAFTGIPITAEPSVQFVHHTQYAAHLIAAAASVRGDERHWGCRVTSVSALSDGGWLVRCENAAGAHVEAEFDAVVDATGRNTVPAHPEVPRADIFDYAYSHSADYRSAEPYRGSRVLVVGNGASAVDIACDLVGTAARVGISVRSPTWYLPKTLLGRPVDQSSGGSLRRIPGMSRLAGLVSQAVVRRIVGSYRTYGLAEPSRSLASSHPVLSDHLLAHLTHGRLDVHPAVVGLAEIAVQFADGTAKFDAVIAATGYREDARHLPGGARRRAVADGGSRQDSRDAPGVAFEPPGMPGLYLMNRFRCADAAVRCAEVQAAAIARAMAGRAAAGSSYKPPVLASPASRVSARTLQKVYEVYR